MYDSIANKTILDIDFFGNIKVIFKHPSTELIGVGKSAAVFLVKNTQKVIKIFHSSFSYLAKKEKEVYEKLSGFSQFPSLYGFGECYIVIDYIKGVMLFDYLCNGFDIEENYIKSVDECINFIKEKGLNPIDIHLKNIIITELGVKIIDVARFSEKEECNKWNHLKFFYKKLYKKRFFPKKFPRFFLEISSLIYRTFFKSMKKNSFL